MSENVQFSEFEIKKSTAKFGENTAIPLGCVGTLEEAMSVKTVKKKCEGIIKKSRTRGTGEGELKYALHISRAAFIEMFGMQTDGLKAGVYSYGENSVHKEFCYTAVVLDEDGNKMYRAYPRCCVNSGKASKIENGAEEVSEIEVTCAVMPDEYGQGVYEAFAADLTGVTEEQWLNNFSRELVEEVA